MSQSIDIKFLGSKIDYMDYRKLIAESWQYTQSNKKLIVWFGFFPALFTTTMGAGYMAYQFFAFKKSPLFDDSESSFMHDVAEYIWAFVSTHVSWTLPLIIIGIIFLLFNLLVPILAKAAAIQTIARNVNGQKAGVGTGIRFGIMSFLPMFEYHLLIKTFAFFSIIMEISFVLRNLGTVMFKILLPFFIIFVFLSLLLTLLFVYADFYIVIDDQKVFDAMKTSARTVITHWKHTFLIMLLMIMIGVRIIIQAILVFLIPSLIILITGYLATVTLPFTGVLVGGIVGIIALITSAYLNGVVDIFSYTVWTKTFLTLTSEKELSARDTMRDIRDDIGEPKVAEEVPDETADPIAAPNRHTEAHEESKEDENLPPPPTHHKNLQ